MKGIAFVFFITAVICVTLGMIWGIQMSASADHSLAGAHAHLNLVGWASLGLFGLYYHTVPSAAAKALAKIHYAVALAGVVLMVPGIAMAIRQQGEMVVIAGSFLTLASMLIFLFTVATNRG
ncbi:MAG: hypothetical protein ACU0CY_08760 [Maritimibacter harenae]|jgi:cbb3-type cytochrome oxidase subunit 1|uniref:Uncharacterized protein n=1 Tax=Maritimibacter harenae TaxID=2606218 RepID=A0A845M6Q6_9RHOB|nr:hypothetical protein [Maritimibacter harenae]MZR15276.1 hypothetical protein [Maritimibacter harenae]